MKTDNNETSDFLRITNAYELLQQEAIKSTNYVTSQEEEEDFRNACEQQLGLSAEIVEECKQNPAFLRWLSGRTDSAHYWRSFFHQNGGLAPRLQHLSRYDERMLQLGSTDSHRDKNRCVSGLRRRRRR
jgi:hypothetical protein